MRVEVAAYWASVILAIVVIASVPADTADAVMVMLVGWIGGVLFARAFL